MQLEVNGLIWRSADDFYIHIYNDYTGNPSYILDRFYMGFGDSGSIVFPGYLGQGEIWYYLGADYNPSESDTPFITSLSLPTSLNDLNMNEVTTAGSSVSSRDGENVWLFRFNIDFSTFTLSPISEPTINSVLTFFDQSVANGLIAGEGPGKSADNRLNAFRNMLETAADLINVGDYEGACQQLASCYKKCDGMPKPPDFLSGDSDTLNELSSMITELMESLECQ